MRSSGTGNREKGKGAERKSARPLSLREDRGASIPIQVFADHRQVRALGPMLAARSEAKDSCMRDVIATPKLRLSNSSFLSTEEIKKSFHHAICYACEQQDGYGVEVFDAHEVPDSLLYRAIPKQWIRMGTKEQGGRCPVMHAKLRVAMTPELGISAVRHAYAHIGGWSALDADDRYRVAYEVNRRLASPDRIRFAHVERMTHRVDEIREYWAELLAFALSVVAKNEAEWRRAFLARAIQRSAGAPMAYPMPETGEKDLRLVEWYLQLAKLEEPWRYASDTAEWIRTMNASTREDRVRYAISGFPPGRLRMIFSALIQSSVPLDSVRALSRMNQPVPMHLIPWLEHASVFADLIVSMADQEDCSLFGKASELAADWESFSSEDRRYAEKLLHQYVAQMQTIV